MSDNNDVNKLRYEVLAAFQDALLGMVTPNLRGVSVSWADKHISGLFIYDGAVTDIEEEIVSDTETYVIAHFNDYTIDILAKGGTADVNLDEMSLGSWVYRRSE